MTTKLDRQRATATMTKCECGNVVRLGSVYCGRCANAYTIKDEIRVELLLCHTVDDLKAFIATHLMERT